MLGMLRSITHDSVHSSYTLTKKLVLELKGLRKNAPSRFEQRTASFRRRKGPLPSVSGGSATESEGPGDSIHSEGESSGALNTEDATSSVPFIREEGEIDLQGFLLPRDPQTPTTGESPNIITPSPGGTSNSSNLPLAHLKGSFVIEPQGSHNLDGHTT